MSKKSPQLPDYATPNPMDIIDKEAEVNRYDVSNPYGSSSWSQDPATGRYSQDVELSPEIQGIFDQQLSRTMAGSNKNPFEAFSSMTGDTGNNIMQGLLGKVGDRYAPEGGMGSKPPTSQTPPQMGPPSPDSHDDRKLADAMLLKKSEIRDGMSSDWANRHGQLDARDFRDANGGQGFMSLKRPSGV